jgi:flavin reductase (DIM6/NTAB) family NADH-FMN oxidoreductase RutF
MKRPWNIIDLPIYSLQTTGKKGNINMNICTYVSAISIKPKMYSIAIDYNTKTFENLENSSEAILQILSFDNMKLVRNLGKKSGYKLNKNNYLMNNDLLRNWKGSEVLKNVCACLKLKKKSSVTHHGDHAIYFFDVITYKTFSDHNILTFQDLVNNKIIL